MFHNVWDDKHENKILLFVSSFFFFNFLNCLLQWLTFENIRTLITCEGFTLNFCF